MIRRLLLWLVPTQALIAALCARGDFIGLVVCESRTDGIDSEWQWGTRGLETREQAWAMLDCISEQVAMMPSSAEQAARRVGKVRDDDA
jgi:hypothetical protein